jgi:hypothetical protein
MTCQEPDLIIKVIWQTPRWLVPFNWMILVYIQSNLNYRIKNFRVPSYKTKLKCLQVYNFDVTYSHMWIKTRLRGKIISELCGVTALSLAINEHKDQCSMQNRSQLDEYSQWSTPTKVHYLIAHCRVCVEALSERTKQSHTHTHTKVQSMKPNQWRMPKI